MIIKDLFKKPIDRSIQGVVTIGNEDINQKKQELEEYVCTDEIIKQFRIFFRKYRESISNPTEKMAAWITGFFGSGKSHFLKILGYILENEVVDGIPAIEYFRDKIHDSMIYADMQKCASQKTKVVLFNIDSKAKSDSKNKTQAIMDIMLRCFNESVGYCGSIPWVADLERMLDEEGKLDDFAIKFEEFSKRNWKLNRTKAAINKDSIIKSLVAVLGVSEDAARTDIDQKINSYTNSTEDFAKIVNNYCLKNKTRIIFLIDEVGQFIGDNTQLMLNLQTCVEDLGKYCRGQAWVVITSQQELKAMIDSTKDKQQDFSKIQARFDTRILLSGAEAGEVIKKRILEKKENAIIPLQSLYDGNSNKISNLIMFHGAPTWSGYKDSKEFMDVYPFVPYQFELLQKVFTSIREHGMSEGKNLSHSERSLLSAFQESAKVYATKDTNVLVPFDSFYQTLEQFIDWDIKTVFTNAEKRPTISEFDLRVLRVLFMILHVKEMPATIDRIATLMVESVLDDKVILKNKIAASLKVLEQETLIQKNGDEFDFLTNAEQDVNKQINHVDYNENEVKQTILEIVYDRILESNKLRYKNRYDFALNRFVDDVQKGSNGIDNITIKIMTNFSGLNDSTSFGAESTRNNALVVDLTEGNYIEELIRMNRISIFKRNNSVGLSVAMTEIMAKKSAELSERLKRAEEIIKDSLRSAPIYFNGVDLNIPTKDGKDRIIEALYKVVEQDYYKLGYVTYFYQDQREVVNELLAPTNIGVNDLSLDGNFKAYDEIFNKIKLDKTLGKRTTVKTLIDNFSKKPYGWRDLDILGMIAKLFNVNKLQILIHDSPVDKNNVTFRSDFSRKNNIDSMVVRVTKVIDDAILYAVKKIMNDVYSVTLQMNEQSMKGDILNFFKNKETFLKDLKTRYGSVFPGSSLVPTIYNDIQAIVKTTDSETIFNEIISRRDSLENNVDYLEQLESFYNPASSQKKVYEEAKEIINWYALNNSLLNDLSKLENVISQMDTIIKMQNPFGKMQNLAKLVFDANEVKQQILQEKYDSAIKQLNLDFDIITKELNGVMGSDLSDTKKNKVSNSYDDIKVQYQSWLSSLNINTTNIDSYLVSSTYTLQRFKQLINKVISESEGPTPVNPPVIRKKNVKVIDIIPIAKKKVKSQEDIDNIIKLLKDSLEEELRNNDEIDLI